MTSPPMPPQQPTAIGRPAEDGEEPRRRRRRGGRGRGRGRGQEGQVEDAEAPEAAASGPGSVSRAIRRAGAARSR